jgi:hypothetical protein
MSVKKIYVLSDGEEKKDAPKYEVVLVSPLFSGKVKARTREELIEEIRKYRIASSKDDW